MLIKKVFISLLALNALLVLYVSMDKKIVVEDDLSRDFVSVGEKLQVITTTKTLPIRKVVDHCLSLGPIDTKEMAEQIYQRLNARNVVSEILKKDVLVSTDYWVIIPPRKSERQALRLLKQLQLANIDSYVVTQGDFSNANSLGLFTVENSAYRIKEKMEAAGFDSVVQEIPRRQIRYWVEVGSTDFVLNGMFDDLNVKINEKSCKSR